MSIKDLISDIKQNGLLASMAQLEKLYQVAIENEQKLAESEFRCAALAAENAGLKSKAAELVHEASEVYSAYNSTITEPDGDFMDMQTLQEMQCVETPATDAFLAEVRAQGADECVRQLVTSDDDDFSDAPNICAMVAYQLRKGVQS